MEWTFVGFMLAYQNCNYNLDKNLFCCTLQPALLFLPQYMSFFEKIFF